MKFLLKYVWVFVILTSFFSVVSCEEKELDVSLLNDRSNPVVKFDTSMGHFFVELYKKESPESVDNFLMYVKKGFYTGTIFHRVIHGFMSQGGGFESGLKPKKGKSPIKNEASNGLSNARGTLAMARTSVVDSATSQFFINARDNKFLDYTGNRASEYGYAVFGKVVEGMGVVDLINKARTTTKGHYDNVPEEDIVINRVVIVKFSN